MKFEDMIAYRILTWCKDNDKTINRLATLSELSQTAVESIAMGKTKKSKFLYPVFFGVGNGHDGFRVFGFQRSKRTYASRFAKIQKAQKGCAEGENLKTGCPL